MFAIFYFVSRFFGKEMTAAAVLAAAALMFAGPVPAVGPGPSEPVVGITMGGVHKAYPVGIFESSPVINDQMGQLAVMVFYDVENQFAAAFFRLIGGEPLEFSGRAANMVADDLTTATRWDMKTGTAVSGNLTGMKLIPIPAHRMVFSEWMESYPGSVIYSH